MDGRSKNLKLEIEFKAKFRAMQGERGRIDHQPTYVAVRKLMEEAELNALQTDYAQDGREVDEHFWRTVFGSMSGLLSDHKNCPLEVRNWFWLQGIWA